MKKIIALALLVVTVTAVCVTTAACSNDTEAASASDKTSDTAADTKGTAESDTAAATAATTVSDAEFATYLGEIKTCQYFTDDPVDEADVETIVNAGINAQSGMNQQDWHFTAVASKDIMDEIADDMGTPRSDSDTLSRAQVADAPLLIIVSCGEGTEYDAGLATQAMNAAALALGYGTKIISSPTSVLNGERQDYYRELLGIPEDMETVGMLLVGEALDTSDLDPDSITAATTRNSYDEMTTYLP